MKKPFHKHDVFTSGWVREIKNFGCETIATKYTFQVKTDEGKHIASPRGHLPGKELAMINAVNKDVSLWYEQKKDSVDFCLNKKVKYKALHLNTLKRNFDSTVHCFDLKSAYPTFMFNQGMITKETWEKVSNIPKEHKLWVAGSIATTKYITKYSEGKEVSHEVKVKPTKAVWQYVVYMVDRLMQKLFSEFRSFYNYRCFSLSYYVDCLFVLCDSPTVMEIFTNEFSEMVFKEGFTYGYSQLKLIDFDVFTKKITLGTDKGEAKIYFLSDNGYYQPGKLIEGI